MRKERWMVEATAEGRNVLHHLISEYEDSGQIRELGLTYDMLARLVFQLGTGDESPAFDAMITYAARATELLRQTDDLKGLAGALCTLAHPWANGQDAPALLKESLAIYTDLNDWAGQGRVFSKLALCEGQDRDQLLKKAQFCQRRAGNKVALAVTDQQTGVRKRDYALLMRAARAFESAGAWKRAAQACYMTTVFCGDQLSFALRQGLIIRSYRFSLKQRSVAHQRQYLSLLSASSKRLARKKGSMRKLGVPAKVAKVKSRRTPIKRRRPKL